MSDSMSDVLATWLPRSYEFGIRAGQTAQRVLADPPGIPEMPMTLSEMWRLLTTVPYLYKEWWMDLLTNDPVHVFVETTLLLSVVYMLVSRSKDWREDQKEKLSPQEEEELARDWKDRRAPLVEPIAGSDAPSVVVDKFDGKFMEVFLDDETPKYKVLNFATFDFLGLSASLTAEKENNGKRSKNPVKQASVEALDRYGVGACGPRGFYGTIDPHLKLEDAYTKFMGSDGAILYSDGASTCTSTVAAFAKRGDLLVVDEGVNEPLLAGVKLSRSDVKWFKHNDMDDLRRVLEGVRDTDKKLGRAPNAQRRFIVIEGLYKNTGSIAALDQIIALKHEFKCRLILDESFSFGTLGKTGRGALELYNKRLMYDAEIVTIALENAMGGIGGITIGNEEVVDHQRLSGSGYCFSASSPPFTASAACESLEMLKTRPELLQSLESNKTYFYSSLTAAITEKLDNLLWIASDERSPLVFLMLSERAEKEHVDDVTFTAEVVRECIRRGVATCATGQPGGGHLHAEPPPAIRFTVSAAHDKEDLDKAVKTLVEAVAVVKDRYVSGAI